MAGYKNHAFILLGAIHVKPPFIVIEVDPSDVQVFETLDQAVRSVEAFDVQEGEYLAFDGDGRMLKFTVVPKDGRPLVEHLGPLTFVRTDASIELHDGEEMPTHQLTLGRYLARALERLGIQRPDAPLSELVELGRAHLKGR